jgi:murein DD-endopeptidase MepM/ murein hydrolase activator NlpD
MNKPKKKNKELKKKWLHHYRLVVLNEDTYEEKYSLKLNRLSVFVYLGLGSIFLVAITTLIIAFTPLREYIPGYSSTDLRRTALLLEEQTDSLSRAIRYNNLYLERIRMVLNGDYTTAEMDRDSLLQNYNLDTVAISINPIKEDSILREQVSMDEKYNLFYQGGEQTESVLYPPLEGVVSDSFDPQNDHYAIDIIAQTKAPVKAIAEGMVVFSDWTSETGYVIIIEHPDDFISAYKHNGSLFKKQGDQVEAGEVIATVGNTGEYTTGPHLHFELWKALKPVNPTNYIDFN